MSSQPNITPVAADPTPNDPWAQLKTDLAAYEVAQEQLKADEDEIKKLLAMIVAMKNPLIGIQMLMLQMMDVKGDSIKGLASVDNVDSDLRSIITGAQGDINAQGEKADSSDMGQFMKSMDSLEKFLKDQEGGNIIDGGAISSMISGIDSVKTQFTDSSGNSVWGDPGKMATAFQSWLDGEKNGTTAPELGSINGGLQTLNQSTSALSTTTNTRLQYVVQVFQQIEGITNDTMKLYQQLVTNFVHGQRSQ